jgi:hypothetical protein
MARMPMAWHWTLVGQPRPGDTAKSPCAGAQAKWADVAVERRGRGYEASLRSLNDGATVPLRMEAASRQHFGSWRSCCIGTAMQIHKFIIE